MKFGPVAVEKSLGAILAHSIGGLKKGRKISAIDITALQALQIAQITVAVLEPFDVPEDEAAQAISIALAGQNITVQAPFTGRANVFAECAGLVVVDEDRLRAINRVHESITIACLKAYQQVEKRQMLATVKIIQFAVPHQKLDEVLALMSSVPLLRVAQFLPKNVGLIITKTQNTKPSIVAKSEKAISDRVKAHGSALGQMIVCKHGEHDIALALNALQKAGCSPLLVFGATAIVDRQDVVPAALIAAGGQVLHLGMPVDPGNMLMLGKLGSTSVVGVPTCARSPKLNGFDWVLNRLLAGIEVLPEDIMDMGAGGLLAEIALRPQPRSGDLEQPKRPRVAAIVLAAGLSSRMGTNKLLIDLDGKPLLVRTLEEILSSGVEHVLVVTGHQAEEIKAAISYLNVQIVHNPNYAEGLSGSVKMGIAAVESFDAAFVCLGDMPLVKAADLDQMIAAFDVEEGRDLIAPVQGRKLGNPVLWGRNYFGPLQSLGGDRGARSLLEAQRQSITEIEIGHDGILLDADTPEALAKIKLLAGF